MSDVWNPVSYAIRKGCASGFRFVIEVDGKDEIVRFKNNLYKCPSAVHEKAIEALMQKPQFTQNIQKVDVVAGEAIAKAHMAAATNMAAKGGMTSEMAKGLENKVAAADVKAVKDATDTLAKDGLIITESTTDKPPGFKLGTK